MDTPPNSSEINARSKKLSVNKTRNKIYIIFIEFDSAETSTIISFLRENNFAPRGNNIESMDALKTALSERTWDLILCKPQQPKVDLFIMTRELAALEKDIPVLQLCDETNQTNATQALLNNVQAVFLQHDTSLLLLYVEREYSQLENRRRARRLEQQLEDSQRRCRLLRDHSALAIAVIEDQKLVYLNNAFSQLFGYQVTTLLLNKSILSLVAEPERSGIGRLLTNFSNTGQNKQSYQLLAQRADNSNFTVHLELQQISVDHKTCIEITIDSNQHQLQKNKFADIDAITGLYNLNYFTDRLESSIRQAQRGGNDCHLIYIEILNLITVRSQLGNEASRTLARDIADILNDEFSKAHLKARLADNIFAIIYSDPDTLKTKQVASATFDRISQHITQYEDNQIEIQSIFAIVHLCDTSPGVQQIFERGQSVINHCQNKPQVSIFNAEHGTLVNDNQRSLQQVKAALENNQLQLLFQPLVPLVFNSKYQHYEVLLRMIDENEQHILPAHFLASIKNANLNEEMDRWVISQSISRFRQQLSNKQQLKFFINITDTVWQRDGLLLWLGEQLRLSRIQADHIVIQISESESANKLSEAEYFVNGLRQLNCLVCLKHYGSTNTSKNILKILDPDYVKFDGSFIQELAEEAILDNNFVALLSNLTNLGKITIAPQVENPQVMSLLWKSGLGMVQGYYLQPPTEDMKYQF